MKNLKILVLLLLFSQVAFTQNIDECKKIVNLTIESINDQSSEKLNSYLSNDFTIAGQKGEIAKLVLNQLLSQLKDTVKYHKELSIKKLDKELQLKYSIDYEKMESKEATFIFNKNNLLKDLNLFKMEVKSMSGNSEVKKSNQDIIEIPFTMAGNLIAVNVLLNGENKNFLLDSGSPKVVINSKYLTKKGSVSKSISSLKGASGNISGLDIMKVEQLNFSGIQLNNQDVLTLNLSHIEKELNTNIYGLIGFELIKDYDIIFDYQNLKLILIKPNTFEKYKNEKLLDNNLQTVPFILERHIPVINVQIDNTMLSFGIDCGAESNLISDSLFKSLNKSIKSIKSI